MIKLLSIFVIIFSSISQAQTASPSPSPKPNKNQPMFQLKNSDSPSGEKNYVPKKDKLLGVRDIGNGGDAVVCEENGKKTAELLDYYEGRKLLNWQIDLGPATPDSNGVELALRATERIRDRFPESMVYYRDRIQNFFKDARIEYGAQFHEIDDANVTVVTVAPSDVNHKLEDNYLFLPANCKLVQAAIRRNKRIVPDTVTFSINGDVWALMSPLQKAGLILHEVVYEDMLLTHEFGVYPFNKPEPDTRNVRYTVAAISSPMISSLGDPEFLQLMGYHAWFLEENQFPEIMRGLISLRTPDQEPQFGQPLYAELKADTWMTIGRHKFKALGKTFYEESKDHRPLKIRVAEKTVFRLDGGNIVARAGTEVGFTNDGKLASAFLDGETEIQIPGGKLTLRGNPDWMPVTAIEETSFTPDKWPQRFFADTYRLQILPILSKEGRWSGTHTLGHLVKCDRPRKKPCVYLTPEGHLKSIELTPDFSSIMPIEVVNEQGNLIEISKMIEEANEEASYTGAPKRFLPEKLEFNEKGQALCPYRSKSNGQCFWSRIQK